MVMLDTNIILRYLLNDDERMASEAERIIKNMSVQVTIEIVAEVIYVLKGVYHIGRAEIRQCLFEFLSEVTTSEPEVLNLSPIQSLPQFRAVFCINPHLQVTIKC